MKPDARVALQSGQILREIYSFVAATKAGSQGRYWQFGMMTVSYTEIYF